MKLQNIEIKGFKSFANPTVLNFNDQVTGIVGPNGSGKSNIVDAIRWVLGEQKGRELRLDQMSDVIFNGTKTRKAGGVAQVSMTFENNKGLLSTEYSQVTISRLLYRNGDSEYRLNNVTCRLKDIKSLLMDTGIGSNSYAIIALGMVDDILSDKEQARRRMFEQAAGISKFKIRKKETVSKLKLTTTDLDRVEDLLFEIQENLKSLERQAKKAEKYLKLKDEYKSLSIHSAHQESKALKIEFSNLKEQINVAQDAYRAQDTQLISLEAKLSKEKVVHLEREKALSQFQKEQNTLLEELRKTENEKSLNQQKIQFTEERISNTIKNKKEDQEKIKQLHTKIDNNNKAVAHALKQHAEIGHLLDENIAKYNKQKEAFENLKDISTSINAQREAYNRKIIDLDKEIAIQENNISGFLMQKESLDQEQANIIEASKQIQEDIEQKMTEVHRFVKMHETLTIQRNKAEEELGIITKQKSEKLKVLESRNRKIDALHNEYDLLKSMIDSFEGYPESMKFLQQNWKGELVLLSDIIEVDDTYKLVIEQYLDPYLNHYVLNSVKEAYAAINILSESQQGKANFFILERLTPIPKKTDSYINDPRLKPVLDILKYDSKYEMLMHHVFNDCYALDVDIQTLDSIDYIETTSILSVRGTFVDRGTSLYGGSVGLFEGNKIGRKQKLLKISDEIERLENIKQKIAEELDQLSEKEQLLNQSKIEEQLSTIDKSRLAINSEILVLENQRKNIKDKQENTIQKIELLEQSILESREKITLSNAEKTTLINDRDEENNQEEISDGITRMNVSLTEMYEEQTKYKMQRMQSDNLIERYRRDLTYDKNRLRELENHKMELESTLIRSSKEQDVHIDLLKQAEEKLIDLYQRKGEKTESFGKVEREYHTMRSAITGLEDEIRATTKSQNKNQIHINQLKEQYTNYKLKLKSIAERIEIEFKIKLAELPEQDMEFESIEGLHGKVEKLRSRLYNYGEVNPMAVAAYQEMQKRHNTIVEQRDDILNAKASLIKTIKEIETSATEMYLNSFNQVRANFREVFRSLFTKDDDCDLILLDPDNPVDSQIDIIAKPKGKRPKSLSQLSGGEKTLTAIALLFGLYLLKPAPFCIFDEVDAPLDDANIQKFNRIIKKFSSKSQFIIVTHNKSTMADVDVLYGVFMQEQGVSGVAPVDFRQYKNDQELRAVQN